MKRRDCHRCDNFYECRHGGDVVASSGKKLERYCLYCMGTPQVGKLGIKHYGQEQHPSGVHLEGR